MLNFCMWKWILSLKVKVVFISTESELVNGLSMSLKGLNIKFILIYIVILFVCEMAVCFVFK